MPAPGSIISLVRLAIGLAAAAIPVAAARPAAVTNTASLSYALEGQARTVLSNTVTADILDKRPTALSFRRLPNGYALHDMACQTSPTVRFTPSPITAGELAAAAPLASLDITNPLILVLDAPAENHDPASRETAWITVNAAGRQEAMPLLETGPDTGQFAGGLPASGGFPELRACDLTLIRSGNIVLSFSENNYSYASAASLLIDPTGYTFDSRSGEPVNGTRVTIVDAVTGAPAPVIAEDGVSAYPSSIVTGDVTTDASGHQYALPKGNFRFPLLPKGNYRLKVEPPPGYSAPSIVKPDAIAKLSGGPAGGYLIVDASYGGIFTLDSPAPVQIDVPLDSARGQKLLLDKTSSIREASPGDFIQYRLVLTNKDVMEADAVSIVDSLPLGLRYRVGSMRSGTAAIAQPLVSGDGRRLTFTVPVLAAGAAVQISYIVEVAPGAPQGEAVNHAAATGADAISSNDASASVRVKPLLFTDALTLIGRVTEGRCGDPLASRKGVAGVRLMLENGTLVVTDRDGLYHVEGLQPGTHVVQIDTASVPPTLEPVSCDADTRQAGNPLSRFVEGDGGSLHRADFLLRPNGKAVEEGDEPAPIAITSDSDAAGNRADWLAQATPGIDWMFPQADHNPRAPALRVVIRHAPGQRIALTVNGDPVDPLAFDGTDEDVKRGVAVSIWTGLPLKDRGNLLEARVLDGSGKLVTTLTRTVHYANAPSTVVYAPEKSRLVADGLVRPLIAVRVLDSDGRPVRAGTVIPFRVDQPYTAAQEVALQQSRQLAGIDRSAVTARVVGDEGLAFIALQPTTQAGEAHVSVILRDDGVDKLSEIRAWLAASQKDWVVVGFGKGTLGYSMLRKRSEAIPAGGTGVTTDGQLALYAKGRIKGSWLLTVAYDSDKRYDPDRGLLGAIDPNRYYTVYGDGTQQTYDASTKKKLYLRLERREFYALFGDYQTGFTETRLGRYDRTLNGVKAEYHGRHVTAAVFAAHDDQLYGRDEILGNGLSGPYRLSASNIVVNSDQITIETRDRFRSEKIIDSRTMTRNIDYDIDPIAGTIRFREPILGHDQDLNPIFIVVDYETYGASRKLAAGGRVSALLLHDRLRIGATGLRDETLSKATVGAVDLKLRVDRATELRAEAGTGGRQGITHGQAFLAELEHHGNRVDALGYVQRQDDSFGLGQQNFAEAGTQKAGLDGKIRLAKRISVTGSGWYQNALDGSSRRYAGDGRIEYRRDKGTLFTGLQVASDRTIGATKRDSRLLTFGGSENLFHNKVQVTGQTMVAIGGEKGSVDFPIRHKIDVAWRVTPGIRLLADQEIADGSQYRASSTRFGFDVAPWTGAKLTSTLNQEAIGEYGPRSFARYGLTQSLPLGRHWTIDATLDASNTLKGKVPAADVVNPFQPVSSGTIAGQDGGDGDYKAATMGATYRSSLWTWNGRLEYRVSDESRRWGVVSNLLRTLGAGKTLASSIRAYQVKQNTGGTVNFTSADVALAIRPLSSHWSLLERLELRQEGATGAATSSNALAVPTFAQGDDTTTRVLNSVAVNYRAGDQRDGPGWEASLYYGAKYVRGRYADEIAEGFIDVIGAEIRKDVTTHVDVGITGSVQHGWTSKAVSFSGGPSIGVSPGRDMWISVGYNIAGYRDHDFEQDRYTRQGPYITMRMKFDQTSLRNAANLLRGGP